MISPPVGRMNLVRRLKQVVLPAPFGPINAWMLPRTTGGLSPLPGRNPAIPLVSLPVRRITSPPPPRPPPPPRRRYHAPVGRRSLPADQAGTASAAALGRNFTTAARPSTTNSAS